MAISKLPLLVSKTVAVVNTRVWPRMLPPTIIEAPTSDMTPPNPAMIAGEQRQAGFLAEQPEKLRGRGADAEQLEAQVGIEALKGGHRQAGNDWKCDHHLGDDHRRRRIEQFQKPERAAAPQKDGNEETDDHGRKPHPGIDQADDEAPTWEAFHRK